MRSSVAEKRFSELRLCGEKLFARVPVEPAFARDQFIRQPANLTLQVTKVMPCKSVLVARRFVNDF